MSRLLLRSLSIVTMPTMSTWPPTCGSSSLYKVHQDQHPLCSLEGSFGSSARAPCPIISPLHKYYDPRLTGIVV
jgi:hypothetical protein